jgi:hypothetical protein
MDEFSIVDRVPTQVEPIIDHINRCIHVVPIDTMLYVPMHRQSELTSSQVYTFHSHQSVYRLIYSKITCHIQLYQQ